MSCSRSRVAGSLLLLLGFLFGLGFETSSEVALLALAAMSGSQGIPPTATLVLPLLFASGMALVDTADVVAKAAVLHHSRSILLQHRLKRQHVLPSDASTAVPRGRANARARTRSPARHLTAAERA